MSREMKRGVILLFAIVTIVANVCALLNKRAAQEARHVADTTRVVVYDIIRSVEVQPVATTQLPGKIAKLPIVRLPQYCAVSWGTDCTPVDTSAVDSVLVAVPMERKTYTDSTSYRAVVSGAWVSLDTMEVYARREVVTITQPPDRPKRWHLGVGAGYGITPRGMQPWVGVTLSYSLWSF